MEAIGSERGYRGGAWSLRATQYLISSGILNTTTPLSVSSTITFRVSEVPEPATLALLLVGGLAMLRRRRSG
jgi:hypothetical protein